MDVPEVPAQQPVQPSHSSLPKKLLILLILLVILIAGYFIYFQFFSGKKINTGKQTTNNSSTPTKNTSSYKQFINCDDIRDVIEEQNKLYVACLGGVLITDSTGNVLDQITMTDGLGNATTTSLEKDKEILYIGTQDGFTIFNLDTRDAKKISVKEGLISGSNIILALDGNTLWVGTFEGLSSYDIPTGKIQNITTELVDNSTKYNASNVFVTKQAVYAIISSNAYTPGGIARFDKKEKTWERFGPSTFIDKSDEDSLNFFHITSYENRVYVAGSSSKTVWEIQDTKNAQWKKIELPLGERNTSIYALNANKDGLSFVSEGTLFQYNVSNQKLTTLYPTTETEKSLLSNNGILAGVFTRGNKVWGTTTGMYPKELLWLSWVNLENLEKGSIELKGRPASFEKIVAAIDSDVLIYGSGKMYKYSSQNNTFSKIFDFETNVQIGAGGSFNFEPIPNTHFVFIFSQSCGQGCSKPEALMYDYTKDSAQSITIPDIILNENRSEIYNKQFDYSYIVYENYDSTSQTFIFKTSTDGKEKIITYNYAKNTWNSKIGGPQENIPEIVQPVCNHYYEFEKNNNTFSIPSCGDTSSWSVVKNTLYETQENNATTELNFPSAPAEYSPFNPPLSSPNIKSLLYSYNKLWISTDRGISVYDTTAKTWELIDTKKGLISNDIENFVVGKNNVWVISHWGGLSQIPY